MTRYDFDEVTSELETFYEKKLNPTQKQVWFEELQDYTKEKYKQAVRKMFKTQQYRPTLSVVLETISNIKTEETPNEPVSCEACKGTGYVLYTKVVDGREYQYASLCNCQNAIGKEYDGTKVADKEHRSLYYIPKATDVFGAEV